MGRHSKKTTSMGKKALAGSAAAAALAGIVAPQATAAPDSDWDKLAQCESGGNWSINTGNGYQGGDLGRRSMAGQVYAGRSLDRILGASIPQDRHRISERNSGIAGGSDVFHQHAER